MSHWQCTPAETHQIDHPRVRKAPGWSERASGRAGGRLTRTGVRIFAIMAPSGAKMFTPSPVLAQRLPITSPSLSKKRPWESRCGGRGAGALTVGIASDAWSNHMRFRKKYRHFSRRKSINRNVSGIPSATPATTSTLSKSKKAKNTQNE